MSELSQKKLPNASSYMGVVRERLGAHNSTYIAEAMGKDDSWARKIRNQECGVLISDFEQLLNAIGLKVVEKDKTVIDCNELYAYEVLAGKWLEEVVKSENKG